MDLPDCPPGAEGYHDSVTEVAKKPTGEAEDSCTKAEQEFSEHLNSLKIHVDNVGTRSMVERRGRDISGKWIYLCYPCAAVCSGESILQTHISGKKHKTKLAMRTIWPQSIFDDHPYILSEKGTKASGSGMEKVLQKMAEEVELFNKNASEMDNVFGKYKNVPCHIQESIDNIKAPLLGLEYLIEHPPEQSHYEPSYICTLCTKQGHPRTIINHMTCFWHRYNYLVRHFTKACKMLTPYRAQPKYREGVSVIMNRVAQRIEDTFGRLRPMHIDKEEYEKDKERIHQWIFKGHHFSETSGHSFEEVVDVDLITTLHNSKYNTEQSPHTKRPTPAALDGPATASKLYEESKAKTLSKMRDPSPPIVAAPSKPHYRGRDRRPSVGSLSDISDEQRPERGGGQRDRPPFRGGRNDPKPRFEPYPERERRESPPTFRSRYAIRNNGPEKKPVEKEKKAPNYEYKVKLAEEKCKSAEESAKKTLAYHEKNPEKHPLYPEEWKKFWNRRYKEIQAEGKDAAKHDFKPEWIVFWTARMKELHDQELRVNINEIHRKLCLPPPPPPAPRDDRERERVDERRRSQEPRRRSPEPRRRSPEPRRRSPELRRRSPSPRRRSPSPRRPPNYDPRRRSPELRPVRPDHRREFDNRRREPDYRRENRTPDYRRSPGRHMEKRPSPGRINNFVPIRSRSPVSRARSPARTHIVVESLRRSRSPLSRRGDPGAARNRSPHPPHRSGEDLHTVMISDDELKPDDGGISPWNSSHSLESLGSLPDARSPPRARSRGSRAGSLASHPHHGHKREYGRPADPQDLGPAENVVATLRLLVALEDYLGSLGPKIVDLLAEALKMEKECANSSEELLVRESAVVLLETAKEKLKGAAQAGLVPAAAAGALRGAVVRTAATLHEADTRARRKQQQYTSSANASGSASVPVAGVGAVDREQIAAQIAAALVAQGKTDVSTEELAQLVDDVVGMAEAKKREAEVKKKVEARALADKASRPPPPAKSSGASALQMLQSAYDENDKKEKEKENAPDAMDGLSDSDLETLLKNFNELSAEEQHSLIAYLKKLEAREPQRVERLRQYVSAAADDPPPVPTPAAPATTKPVVTIESDDDDDYTVEEVFQSATQKVKEDQIRQEMEIVKKSLEETKAVVAEPEVAKPALLDITKNISSASDIFALVQASIQSKSSVGSAPVNPTPDVVTSNVQPRSFGDRPEALPVITESTRALLQTPMNQMPTLPLIFGQQGPGNQAPGFQGQGNQGPGFQGQGNQGPGFQGQGNQGSGFQGSGNQGPGFQGQGNQGSGFQGQGNQASGFQGQSNQGSGFQGQGNQGPGFQGQGNQGSGFQQGHGNQGQGNQTQGFQQGQGNQGPGFRSGPPNAPPNQNFGGNRNFQNQNDSFNNQPWEQRQPLSSNIPPMNNNMQAMNNNNLSSMNSNMNENRGSLLGPPPPLMGQRPASFENQNQYQGPPRANFMNGQNNINQNQPPNMNAMPPQQYGNSNNQGNFRGRGGRGHYGGGNTNMRGRGRGYF